jgi:flagellar biosynthesis/type III secretory pathway chaperone
MNNLERQVRYNSFIIYKRIKDSLSDEFKLDEKIIEELMEVFWESFNFSGYKISFKQLDNIICDKKLTEKILDNFKFNEYVYKLYQIKCNNCNNIKEHYEYKDCIVEYWSTLCNQCNKMFVIPKNLEPVYEVNYHYHNKE